jgi:hypothetical protein
VTLCRSAFREREVFVADRLTNLRASGAVRADGLCRGGRLPAAVTDAGGLGLIGGGYGDRDGLEREFAAAGNAPVGCGFITWSLQRRPELLDLVLAHSPAALMLSFGPPAPFAPAIKKAGAFLICQAQCLRHAQEAVAAGADIIVAHGAARDTDFGAGDRIIWATARPRRFWSPPEASPTDAGLRRR